MDIISFAAPLVILSIILFLLSAYKSKQEDPFNFETRNIDGWEISVLDSKVSSSLESIIEKQIQSKKASSCGTFVKPKNGKSFLLVKMIADKEEGTSVLDWKRIKVKDSAGKTYKRIDDSFLEDIGFRRMRSEPLSAGINKGWVAFEIDSGARRLKLELSSNNESVCFKLA